MPGLLHHIYFADKVYANTSQELVKRGYYDCETEDGIVLKDDLLVDYRAFLMGNIIPDLGKEKMASHFKVDSKIDRNFKVPDLPWARVQIQKIQGNTESREVGVLLGTYAHLFLDRYFIETYLIPSFEWNFERDRVVNPRNSLEWSVSNFFKKCNGLYQGYDEINEKFVMNRLLVKIPVDELPAELPMVGYAGFDKRKEDRAWKKDYHSYLAKGVPYTGDIFLYGEFMACLDAAAKEFARQLAETNIF